MEFKNGLTVVFTKESGNIIFLMVEGKSLIITVIFMKGNGLEARHVVLESTLIETGLFIVGTGFKIYNTVRGTNNGMIKVAMKVSIVKERNKEMVFISGMMVAIIREVGLITQ